MLVCQVAGRPTAPPLILTHGVTDSAASLADAIRRLSASWQVIAVDTLGHGTSPRFTDNDLARPMEAAVQALRATIVPHVREHRTVALGHSMGGSLLSRLAYESPELFAGIIVEDPSWLTADQAARYRTRRESERSVPGRDDEAVLAETREDYPNWPTVELRPWLEAKDQVDKRFMSLGVVGYVEPWEWLAELSVPTVVLTSDTPDCVIGPSGLATINNLNNPAIETMMIPGLRHVMRRDNPQRFHDIVDPLLERWKDMS